MMRGGRFLVGLGACAAASLGPPASANEGITPFLPGVSTGLPLGTLPVPGFYGGSNNYFESGRVKDGQGHDLPIYISDYELGLSVLWSTPYRILGAHYSAAIVELLASPGVDARASGGLETRSFGAFNPIVEPLNLSWNVGNGLFVASGHTFYLPAGDTHVVNGSRYQTSYANGYFTYEPNVAITYLKDGWSLTANNVVDINALNPNTHYKSGDAYYLDLTAVKKINKVTLGLIGNYTMQFQDDRQYGIVFENGVRAEHLMIGPLLSYNFGTFSVTARYLRDLRTRNDVVVNILHISFAWKF